jgi:hypothetical protein
MIILFALGCALLVGTFLILAVETFVFAGSASALLLSGGEMWDALRPDGIVEFRAWIDAFGVPWLWDPLILSTMALPAWLIPGVGGSFLVWFCHPRRRFARTEDDMDEDSLFLYDRLVKAAQEEADLSWPDDTAPSHDSFDIEFEDLETVESLALAALAEDEAQTPSSDEDETS